MVRIRSEHAIGFLKGRFQSLKGLRVNISDEASHKFAVYWVLACVVLHSFALICEDEERAADEDVMDDPFIGEGMASDLSDYELAPRDTAAPHAAVRSLASAKQRRQDLKTALFAELYQGAGSDNSSDVMSSDLE